MKITYDPEVDALYIRLIDEDVEVTTQRLSQRVALDIAPDGRVVGLEVLDASEVIGRELERVVVEIYRSPVKIEGEAGR